MQAQHRQRIADALRMAWETKRGKRAVGTVSVRNGREYVWTETAKGWRHWTLVKKPLVVPNDPNLLTCAQRCRLRKKGYDIPHKPKGGYKRTIKDRMQRSIMMRKSLFDMRSLARDQKQRIRKSLVYRLWRDSVFQRDNYTCQDCGARSGNGREVVLEAHHVKPYSKFPNLRFLTSNGRTLCVTCHRALSSVRMRHNTNGRRKASNGITPTPPSA